MCAHSGAARLAGSTLPLDRKFVAIELGFRRCRKVGPVISQNSHGRRERPRFRHRILRRGRVDRHAPFPVGGGRDFVGGQ